MFSSFLRTFTPYSLFYIRQKGNIALGIATKNTSLNSILDKDIEDKNKVNVTSIKPSGPIRLNIVILYVDSLIKQ